MPGPLPVRTTRAAGPGSLACGSGIGNGVEGKGSCMVHNPGYDFNDGALPYGASLFARLVERRLARMTACALLMDSLNNAGSLAETMMPAGFCATTF